MPPLPRTARWSLPLLAVALVAGTVASGPRPAVELTAAQVGALEAVGAVRFARRGYGLAFVQTPSDLARPVPCDLVEEHLGFPLPRFPDLAARGFTRVCGSVEGRAVLGHPVPSAAHPPAPGQDPSADGHGVTVLDLPPGVDLHGTGFAEARRRGLVWLTVSWGGEVARQGQDPEPTPPDAEPSPPDAKDATTVRFRDGTPLRVQSTAPSDTRLAWTATVADHHLALVLTTSTDPLTGVRLLADGVDLPL